MNNSFFDIESLRPSIPSDVYKPIKRCPQCQSVYLTETHCEACGRSLHYHPVGKPFSGKSMYGIKERYIKSLSSFVRAYPFFEDVDSKEALSLKKQLFKRFDDLLLAFNEEGSIPNENRRFFYVEILGIMDALYDYSFDSELLESKIESRLHLDSPMLYQALLGELTSIKGMKLGRGHWSQRILEYRICGVLRLDFLLKSSIISATVVAVAYMSYDLVNLLAGK